MFQRILIANRGEIALRIIRTLKKLGIHSILVASEEDRWALPARQADQVYSLGSGDVAQTYLNQEKILQACKETGAQALHPGYGFLSENPDFAQKVEDLGLAFLGPSPQQIRDFGVKHQARALALEASVPLLIGSKVLGDFQEAKAACESIGYPVLLKSSSGGGGIGMEVVENGEDLCGAWDRVTGLAVKNFSSSAVFAERYLPQARHIEVQIFGNGKGGVVVLGDRDCSLQRRNQKVIEECPAPGLQKEVREKLHQDAKRLAQRVGYRSAGTVEFLYDPRNQEYYFLEVNTRLQVEHTVTEEVYGIDLVEAMIRQGAGEELGFFDESQGELVPKGHAIQLRLYAEDPGKNFLPTTGLFSAWQWPPGIRLDTWVEKGSEISARYDPLLAKIIFHGSRREKVLQELSQKLDQCEVKGPMTNLPLLQQLLKWPDFVQNQHHTKSLHHFSYQNNEIEVLSPGMQSTLQDLPGRLGYWHVGIPPSGPMDEESHRLANALLGNPFQATCLEMTHSGAKLRFRKEAKIALTGARMKAQLQGEPVEYNKVLFVKAGSVLQLGKVEGPGQRSYLGIAGGFDVPLYLGSAATFTLGGFGGFQGRALLPGDVLPFGQESPSTRESMGQKGEMAPLQFPLGVPLKDHWNIRVLIGPHGAPEYFLPEDMDRIFQEDWKVNFNSSRTGVRLDGPKPKWAREDGGEAGLHPSNIHDNPYAIGSLDFTGDMPVILGPDGPSLGGFVCPAVVIRQDLWILGQLKPGDRIRFFPVSLPQALGEEALQEKDLQRTDWREHKAVVYRGKSKGILPSWELRRQGDANLLLEIGPMKFDLTLRFLIQGLLEVIKGQKGGKMDGIIDLTPGIRSLQVHYEPLLISEDFLISYLRDCMDLLAQKEDFDVPSRVVHLPLSWDDRATALAIERYLQGVRPNAPWGPSNIEFIRRINGLKDQEAVKEILFSSRYLVMGLGDVYLGAPVATPIDPGKRLVTTKYNPARTWTPENAVGIGGAYLCVYGMEGPGGYQFVGRTLQMWNRHHVTEFFPSGKPWLLDFFDQLQFYPVSEDELLDIRRRFPLGQFPLKIENRELNFAQFQKEQKQLLAAAQGFSSKRSKAYHEERQRWVEQGLDTYEGMDRAEEPEFELEEGWEVLESPMGGSIWKILCQEGGIVNPDVPVLVLESMKMEVEIPLEAQGQIKKILVKAGQVIKPGDPLVAYISL